MPISIAAAMAVASVAVTPATPLSVAGSARPHFGTHIAWAQPEMEAITISVTTRPATKVSLRLAGSNIVHSARNDDPTCRTLPQKASAPISLHRTGSSRWAVTIEPSDRPDFWRAFGHEQRTWTVSASNGSKKARRQYKEWEYPCPLS